MTQSTKLEIIGPYTPEHEGPFCTRDGKAVRLITRTDGSKEFPIVGFISEDKTPTAWDSVGSYFGDSQRAVRDLMNAREVSVPREFWINRYAGGGLSIYLSKEEAEKYKVCLIGTIHVRAVLPGEGND
ncbi:hypothetical protein [Acetobacter sicerae]|uniref:hypothetical protein n=1 Tax=Acetobacter sicerae TaxID=85325 RepID=UPI00156AEF2C|nr:hypothetical protein [Acetobacter sicerae]NHN93899.1 hypothetical protein [Acetobacter sicerae]